jgi:hypothetical protein
VQPLLHLNPHVMTPMLMSRLTSVTVRDGVILTVAEVRQYVEVWYMLQLPPIWTCQRRLQCPTVPGMMPYELNMGVTCRMLRFTADW